MAIEFRCTACSKLLRVPDDSAGKQAKCPHCQGVMTIPLQSQGAAGPGPTGAAPTTAPGDLFSAGGILSTPTPGGVAPQTPTSGYDPMANNPGAQPQGFGGAPQGFGSGAGGGYTPGAPGAGQPAGAAGFNPSGYAPGQSPNLFGDAPAGGTAFNPYQSPGAPAPVGQMPYGGMNYGPNMSTREAALAKVKGPAIGMLVYVVLWGLVVIVNIVATIAMGGNTGFGPAPQTEEERVGQMVGLVIGVLLVFVFGALIALGSLKMMKLESWGLALTAAILSVIPCNVCCFVGLPIGIWGIVVLLSQDVKYWFNVPKMGAYGGYPPGGMPPGGMGPYGR